MYDDPNGRTTNNPYAFSNKGFQSEELNTPAIDNRIDAYFDFGSHEQNPYAVPYREEQRDDYRSRSAYYEQPDNNYTNGYARPNRSNLYGDNYRVATIGKRQGQRMPPVEIAPPVAPNAPYIPPPDYSPPSSPRYERKIKPSLRTTSNYMS